MIPIRSKLEGHTCTLHKLEQTLKPLGYDIGGNWEYEKGCFDYKMGEEDGYQFFRIPFTAVEGELDMPEVVVRIDTPYVLSHVYQNELDDRVNTLTASLTSFDQFSEPKDADGKVKNKYVGFGERLVRQLEEKLL